MLKEKNKSYREIESLEELDEMLEEVNAASKISDDAMRSVFSKFFMKLPITLPSDPYSDEYYKCQLDIYEFLAKKKYNPKNEITEFNVDDAKTKPFPFLASPSIVGNHYIAIGHIIRTMNLPTGSTILEFGAGWGNVTVLLARMGYNVTIIDIEKHFIDLIQKRAKQKQMTIDTIQGDFQIIHDIDRTWNTLLFFECFHHCIDHESLIKGFDKVVAPGGQIIFAAEPITDELPMPWGFRLDGESLWAIRKNGWCELGFQETYFRDIMKKYGWTLIKHVCTETPWGVIFVAKRMKEIDYQFHKVFTADKLLSEIGILKNGKFISNCDDKGSGFLSFGPYINLEFIGEYTAIINYTSHENDEITIGWCDITINKGTEILKKIDLKGTKGIFDHIEIQFRIANPVKNLEVRFWCESKVEVILDNIELKLNDV